MPRTVNFCAGNTKAVFVLLDFHRRLQCLPSLLLLVVVRRCHCHCHCHCNRCYRRCLFFMILFDWFCCQWNIYLLKYKMYAVTFCRQKKMKSFILLFFFLSSSFSFLYVCECWEYLFVRLYIHIKHLRAHFPSASNHLQPVHFNINNNSNNNHNKKFVNKNFTIKNHNVHITGPHTHTYIHTLVETLRNGKQKICKTTDR